jgi:predicted ATP-grasp superfamily ATP-dependent carboligase
MRVDLSGRVLVFGDDMRIFLAVVRSLGRAGKEVHAAPFNWHSPALKSKYVSVVHRVPRYSDDPIAWRASISHLLRLYSFDLIVPCCDRAILPFDAHREEFGGYPIAIPRADAMDLLFDKERTHELCTSLAVPVVKSARLATSDSAEKLIGQFGLPLVLKPRRSYWADRLDSWGKVWIVDTATELQRLLASIRDSSRYLVEAYFDGVGVGVSVLSQEGKVLHAFQHRRLREGRGGSSSYRVSEAINPELYGACEKICASTKLTGVCMFEFRWNPKSHDWVLVETNARFWGSLPLPLSLGVDFPRYLYDLLVHRHRHEPVKYRTGVKSRNLVLDGFNLLAGVRHLNCGQVAPWCADMWDFFGQPLRWITASERSDSFVMDDLRPGFSECASLLSSFGQKMARNLECNRRRRRSEEAAFR